MRPALFLATLFAVAVAPLPAMPTSAQVATAFKALDTTGNGGINREEWERGSFALFRAADKNQDDFIEAAETQGTAIAQDTFLRADTDRDGRLGVAEFLALRRAIFQMADIDRDGTLVKVEFELLVLLERFGWQDRNKNDRIELSELRESLLNACTQLDTDRDGTLTAAEMAFTTDANFKRFDRDADGRLTPDEFAGGYRTALLGETVK